MRKRDGASQERVVKASAWYVPMADRQFRPTYSVTPGSLTLWSVHFLRRIKRNRAPLTASNAAIMANTLASNWRFPMNPTLGRWIHSVH